mmetsp:Transcript_6712/g.23880  ORF Transcript_6712/g.23880 Transcript_6712/m.23880 type:complete len:224 (-) Transcript_6712:429-1100(-)
MTAAPMTMATTPWPARWPRPLNRNRVDMSLRRGTFCPLCCSVLIVSIGCVTIVPTSAPRPGPTAAGSVAGAANVPSVRHMQKPTLRTSVAPKPVNIPTRTVACVALAAAAAPTSAPAICRIFSTSMGPSMSVCAEPASAPAVSARRRSSSMGRWAFSQNVDPQNTMRMGTTPVRRGTAPAYRLRMSNFRGMPACRRVLQTSSGCVKATSHTPATPPNMNSMSQ